MVGSQRTAAFGDDIGMRKIVLVGGFHEGVDTVVDIFLDGIVDRALARWRARSVVVDAESTTAVHEVHVISHLMQLDIELRSLAESRLDAANLRNLRTDMEMDESQAVAHVLLVEHLQCFQQLGTGQAELRSVAAAFLPFSAAAAGQLDADADIRTDVEFLGNLGDEFQFVHLLHHDEYLLSHLLCQQGQFDVALVLVAVADNDRVALALHGNHGMELGLGTGFQSQVELASVRDNLLYHRLHLVHLDGIYHIVLALVVVLLRGFLEAAPRLLDAVVEDVGESQQDRRLYIAQRQFVHHFPEVDLHLVLAGGHKHVSFIIDSEIGSTPAIDVVQFLGILNRPFLHCSCYRFL